MSCLKVPERLRSAGLSRESSRSWAFTEKTKRAAANMNSRAVVDLNIFFLLLAGGRLGSFLLSRDRLQFFAHCKPQVDGCFNVLGRRSRASSNLSCVVQAHAEPLARAVVEKIYGLRFPLENQERATKAELGRLGASQTDVRPEVDIIVLSGKY